MTVTPTLRTVLDSAIHAAAPAPEYANSYAALRWTLQLAWDALQQARADAASDSWSAACDAQVRRIVGLTRLVGPLPWDAVDVDLVLDGVYEHLHEAIGMPTPLPVATRRRVEAVKTRRSSG